jgi:hypothetical protein
MPRYFFQVSNGQGITPDEEGIDLQDEAAARRMAMDSVRSIISEEARKGLIDLDGHIDIIDSSGQALIKITFPEAFSLRLPNSKPPV